jgi:hypothetical protein
MPGEKNRRRSTKGRRRLGRSLLLLSWLNDAETLPRDAKLSLLGPVSWLLVWTLMAGSPDMPRTTAAAGWTSAPYYDSSLVLETERDRGHLRGDGAAHRIRVA